MMVLCPNHHHQANLSAIDSEKQYLFKKAPYNIDNGYVDGPLLINSRALAVEVGSNQLVGAGFKFVVDQIPLLELKTNAEHHLLLSMDLYDPDDNFLISITNNEWISGDPLPWDYEYGYNWLRLRRKDRIVSIEVDARKELLRLSGDLYFKKQNFSIKRDPLKLNGVVQNVGFSNIGFVGMFLSADTLKHKLNLVPEPRFGKGMIVSWPDPVERLRRGIDAYERLVQETKVGRNDPCPCGSGLKTKKCCQR